MTVVIVQCRLSSSRLPRKALLPLAGKPILAWTLDAMKKVVADKYILAVDYDSEKELKPIALEYGWECFAGSKDDVLERFCSTAVWADCTFPDDIIVRATADNPFLFYESANQLLIEIKKHPCDYITYTGLPHGSGVEVFNARSLIEACGMTSDSYDHEHVGPALYNHPENFASVMLPSPSRWNYPNFRTTIDTYIDYKRALRIVNYISNGKNLKRPYTTEEICSAFNCDYIKTPVLLIPSIKEGRGTGHLRRCLDIAIKNTADIYIPKDDSPFIKELIQSALQNGLFPWQIIKELPSKNEYSVIITDYFSLDKQILKDIVGLAPIASIDESTSSSSMCDYLLDIIPSYKLNRQPNLLNPGFIPLPKNRKELTNQDDETITFSSNTKILITIGGEDPANLSLPVGCAFADAGYTVTIINQDPAILRSKIPENLQKNIRIVPPVNNLKEKLYLYDIVVTHYGFTAFEAVAAGCAVILLETTSLHSALAQKYGFALLGSDSFNSESIQQLLKNPENLYPQKFKNLLRNKDSQTLSDFITVLANGQKNPCPICGKFPSVPDPIIARTPERTFRRCNSCGIQYISWNLSKNQEYKVSYFFEDYKKQYGKTYLEDFQAIKIHCTRRMSVIDSLFWTKNHQNGKNISPSVLDIGCAMGPFLDAASDSGWQVYGTDISNEAIEYVQNTLHYPAVCAKFPNFDSLKEFGIGSFDAITMWYVIEHFQELDSVLRIISNMLKVGGIFAFSTPSAGGVSGRYSTEKFYNSSPADHFTIWEPNRTDDILKKYGFKVIKKISTGHHPERFPVFENKDKKQNTFLFSMLSGVSHFFNLGDTFEVYCEKIGDPLPKKEKNNA